MGACHLLWTWRRREVAGDETGREGVEVRSQCQSLCSDGGNSLGGQRKRSVVVISEVAEPFVVVVDFLDCIVFAVEGWAIVSLDVGDWRFAGGAAEGAGTNPLLPRRDLDFPFDLGYQRTWTGAGSSIDLS